MIFREATAKTANPAFEKPHTARNDPPLSAKETDLDPESFIAIDAFTTTAATTAAIKQATNLH